MPKRRPDRGEFPPEFFAFDDLPDTAEVRQPVVEALLSISGATVWRRVRSGLLPEPRRRGGTTSWRVSDLRRALRDGGSP